MPGEYLLIVCHPRPGSFNHAVGQAAAETLQQAGGEVRYHDLYAEGFDPVLRFAELQRDLSFDERVLRHTRELETCTGLVIVHPEWWGQPPALLKGWLDRVLRPGVAYEMEGEEFMPKQPRPLLGGLWAAVFCSTDCTAERARRAGTPPLLERVWREGVFAYCGIQRAEVRIFYDVRRSAAARRRTWLRSVEQTVRGMLYPPTP